MGLSKYWETGKVSFYNSLMYSSDLIAKSLFIGLIIFIFINLWQVVYGAGNGIIEGFTINMMIWYFLLTESIVTSPGRIIEIIGDEVQSGNIAHSLNKPYNYILFQYSSSIGSTILRFGMTFIIGSIIVLSMVGGFSISWIHLPLVIVAVILALTLHFLMMALLGIFAFWFEDARSLNFVYQKIVFIIGGMLLPLEIFPDWLANISKALPFSYIAYYPAKLFVSFNWNFFIQTILRQLLWILLMIILIIIAYKTFVKKISINGG
jgi:ABC-2 type transport system permease protein